VALNAAQARRFGAAEPLNITEACDALERAKNQLPVNSAGKSTNNLAKYASTMLADRTQAVCAPFMDARAPQKEDQCQES
jgi:hypothetical protein